MKKKIVLILTLICVILIYSTMLIVANAVGEEPQIGEWDNDTPTILYGDVNGSGSITISDLTKLKNYFANLDYSTGTSTVSISEGADVNGNGSVTIQDLTKLKNYFANYDYSTNTSTVELGPKK